jgi:hypothetical protein
MIALGADERFNSGIKKGGWLELYGFIHMLLFFFISAIDTGDILTDGVGVIFVVISNLSDLTAPIARRIAGG